MKNLLSVSLATLWTITLPNPITNSFVSLDGSYHFAKVFAQHVLAV